MTGFSNKMRRSRIVIELTHMSYPKRTEVYLRVAAEAMATHLGGRLESYDLIAHDGPCKRPECGCIKRDGKHEELTP